MTLTVTVKRIQIAVAVVVRKVVAAVKRIIGVIVSTLRRIWEPAQVVTNPYTFPGNFDGWELSPGVTANGDTLTGDGTATLTVPWVTPGATVSYAAETTLGVFVDMEQPFITPFGNDPISLVIFSPPPWERNVSDTVTAASSAFVFNVSAVGSLRLRSLTIQPA
jgi:hypothetical protein